MASYLEEYGSEEALRAKRARLFKIISGVVVLLIIIGFAIYSSFRNFREESQVKAFLQLLRSQQYPDAYQMWGCTEATPCPNYSFPKFREDWGPQSAHADAASAAIGDVDACGSGVLIRIDYAHAEPVALWVERGTKVIGFAPWPQCPGQRRWRIGAFLKSLFGK